MGRFASDPSIFVFLGGRVEFLVFFKVVKLSAGDFAGHLTDAISYGSRRLDDVS